MTNQAQLAENCRSRPNQYRS